MGQSDRKLLHNLLFYIFHGLKIIRAASQSFSKTLGSEQTYDPERTSTFRNFFNIADTGTAVTL